METGVLMFSIKIIIKNAHKISSFNAITKPSCYKPNPHLAKITAVLLHLLSFYNVTYTFRVSLYYVIAWMLMNFFLETGAIPEI